MPDRRYLIKLTLAAALITAAAALWIGPYGEYCQGDQAKEKYCAAYKISMAVGYFLGAHNGAITALATLAIALFTWTLWRSSERMWIATRDTLRHAEKTAERDMRAYVLISGAKVLNMWEAPKPRVMQISIRNFGKTPAHSLRFWAGTGIHEYPLQSELQGAPAEMLIASDILGPNRAAVMDVPVPASRPYQEHILRIGNAAIYVWGQITYLDAFDQPRQTDFRYMCQGEGLREGKVSPCVDGNKYT